MTHAAVRLDGLCKSFGGIVVAQDIHLDLEGGSVVGLIGPNGAGKTSLFNLISGAVGADSGAIYLNGRLVNHLPMHARARLGLSRTWQHIRLFPSLTASTTSSSRPASMPGSRSSRACSVPERCAAGARRSSSGPWRNSPRCG